MSPTFQEVPPRNQTTALQERVDRLRASMEWAADAMPRDVRDEVRETIGRCDERLELGVDWTIVALAGGTGSGKSTLFNALTGSEFAVPGVTRPTTSHASAAVYSDGAGALLDWLGVREEHRYHVPNPPPELAGLVLLDLPDHDSINGANREVVDRVVPLADLLIWVVDPQKYADHALHSAYLQVASVHGQPSLVTLNQTDRLAEGDDWKIVEDLQRLIGEEGLLEVPVIPISARTGRGIDGLKAELEGAVESGSIAAEAVRADLVASGKALARALAKDAEPTLPDKTEIIDALARLAGVDARARAAGAVAAGRASQVPELTPLGLASVERERLDWIDAATDGLPLTWRHVLADTVASGEELAEALNRELAAAEWPDVERPSGWKARMARPVRAAAASKAVTAVGHDAVGRVVRSALVEPTVRIHLAYRNLDELTQLD
ncbi:GTPase [Demequina zhanjiangensis]|uniref:50S ribosome-binding GTPase n=1 Tax=Demequina zhanjiangensis TaxID=3051659 RepID=A0ABT8G1E6_9MICO|nr:GTPase [Demequina sp. SYSU T00b26]MDN4472961.1 50S ribosome-binding GTPase [Demequina sp. SYSU T00b26]